MKMIEYNYLYNFLNNYGSYINGVTKGSEEWQDVTTNFTKELFQVLSNEEKYLLSKIKTSTTSTWELKWGNDNDLLQ